MSEKDRLTASATIFLYFIFLMLCGCSLLKSREANLSRINLQFTQERSKLQSTLDFAKANQDSEWAEGDIQFYSLWFEGTNHEQKGEYEAAIRLYQKALDTPRYEMESYDVQLALGRVLMLAGKTSEGRYYIEEFIKNAKGELNGEVNAAWVATEEEREWIKKNLRFARWLLKQRF